MAEQDDVVDKDSFIDKYMILRDHMKGDHSRCEGTGCQDTLILGNCKTILKVFLNKKSG